MRCAVVILGLLFLSGVASAVSCSEITYPSSQEYCARGDCETGDCTFYMSVTGAPYCACSEEATTTTISSCVYSRERGGCYGTCPRGESCIEVATGECACGRETTTTVTRPTTTTTTLADCFYDAYWGECSGTCAGGKSCMPTADERCGCVTTTTTTTKKSTTTIKTTTTTLKTTTTKVTTTTLYPVNITTTTIQFTIPGIIEFNVSSLLDSDNDGVPDDSDNCKTVPNGPKLGTCFDLDEGAKGTCTSKSNCDWRPCDINQSDWDKDGIGDVCDNCPMAGNPDQNNTDGYWINQPNPQKGYYPSEPPQWIPKPDGKGDACDKCPKKYNPNQEDADWDSIGDICDNCPSNKNKDQSDLNNNSVGDACDSCPMGTKDSDNDGVQDECDICPSDAGNTCNLCQQTMLSVVPGNTKMPAYFDWRYMNGQNIMTAVRDQGSCGSCYAQGPVSVMEALYKQQEKLQKNISLAVQQHVSLCYKDQYSGSCFGGNILSVMYYTKQNGTVDESCMPYNSGSCVYKDNGVDKCANPCSSQGWCSKPPSCTLCANWKSRLWKISDYHKAAGNIYSVKHALICNGPLVVCSPKWWHCVALVGWNDAKSSWIIKNSWGAGWEQGGYGYIPYSGHDYSEIKDDAWYIDSIQKP